MYKSNCKSCKHWKKVTDYEGPYNSGSCKEIRNKITLDEVGDGYVRDIETDEDFFCNLYERKY